MKRMTGGDVAITSGVVLQAHQPTTTTAWPAAERHVQAARLSRGAQASRALAAADPDGDADRVLTYLYARTPATVLRAGELATHVGVSDQRAAEVVETLISLGRLCAGSTPTRAGIVGPMLLEDDVEVAS